MSVREAIKAQIIGALKGATFPIQTPEELLAAFPQGAETTCQVGDLKMTAGEAGKLLKNQMISRSSPPKRWLRSLLNGPDFNFPARKTHACDRCKRQPEAGRCWG